MGAFPGDGVVKNPSANAGDTRDVGLIIGSGRSPEVGNGNPLQYSCLGNFMDRGAWWVTVHGESESCSVVSDSLRPRGLYSPWNSPGQNIGVGSLSLLQGTFPTQGWNPGLLHCRQILDQLSHKGSLVSASYVIILGMLLY